MEYNNNNRNQNNVYQESVPAGKRKYFFDIRQTRDGDYYVTITERKKRYSQSMDGEFEHERHTIFLYKEDLNKFADAFLNTRDKMKELMPDYDFDQYNRKDNGPE